MRLLTVLLMLILSTACIDPPDDSAATPTPVSDMDLERDANDGNDSENMADTAPDAASDSLQFVVRGPKNGSDFYRWTDIDVEVVNAGSEVTCNVLDLTDLVGVRLVSPRVIQLESTQGSFSGFCDGQRVAQATLNAVELDINESPSVWWLAHANLNVNEFDWRSVVGDYSLKVRNNYSPPALDSSQVFPYVQFEEETQLKNAPEAFFISGRELTIAWYGEWGLNGTEQLLGRCQDGNQNIETRNPASAGGFDIDLNVVEPNEEPPQSINLSFRTNEPADQSAAWVLSIREKSGDQIVTLFRNGRILQGGPTEIEDRIEWAFSDIGGRTNCTGSTNNSLFGGKIWEFIVFEEGLEDADVAAVSTYLVAKYDEE